MKVEGVIHFENDIEELQQWDQQVYFNVFNFPYVKIPRTSFARGTPMFGTEFSIFVNLAWRSQWNYRYRSLLDAALHVDLENDRNVFRF